MPLTVELDWVEREDVIAALDDFLNKVHWQRNRLDCPSIRNMAPIPSDFLNQFVDRIYEIAQNNVAKAIRNNLGPSKCLETKSNKRRNKSVNHR